MSRIPLDVEEEVYEGAEQVFISVWDNKNIRYSSQLGG